MVFKRIISFVLVIAIVFSMFTFTASAAISGGLIYDTETVSRWDSHLESTLVGSKYSSISTGAVWDALDMCMNRAGYGPVSSFARLTSAANHFNAQMREQCLNPVDFVLGSFFVMASINAGTAFDSNLGVWRLYDKGTGMWLVNHNGYFPYYCDSAADVPSDYSEVITESTRKDTWLSFTKATSCKKVSILSVDSLSDLCLTLNQSDRSCSVRDTYINDKRFYVIIDGSNNIYANADGVPYVAHYEKSVTDQKFDYIVNEGDTIVNEGDDITNNEYTTIIEGSTTNYEIIDNSQLIDMSNGTFTYIGGVEIDNSSNDTYNEIYKEEFNIGELIYDFSTQNYQVNTYDVTYNEDNDTYVTNDYYFLTTYNITNVYVTNIGQTELYKPFELYYALPDGRSSADLTAEEIAGMSFEFADCVNYAKSATDTYLRALYHFDGNIDDSSYFSTQGKFEWLSGASIEYMDVGTFNGALYLGPESHSFKINLPSDLGRRDYTVQFRYYQAGSADTQSNIENTLSIGDLTVLQWDEGSIYNGSGTKLTSLAVGVWQEFAVMRHESTLYFYHNGICIGTVADSAYRSGNIVMTLGATTRAYSMLDELRVVNFAVANSGAAYTCTSVPYDTNAVLVLPDSAFPIADEYWNIESSGTNLLTQYGMSDGLNFNSSYLKTNSSAFSAQSSTESNMSPSGYRWKSSSDVNIYGWPYWNLNLNTTNSYDSGEGIVFENNGSFANLTGFFDLCGYEYNTKSTYYNSYTTQTPAHDSYGNGKYYTYLPTYGVYTSVACYQGQQQYLESGIYTLSLVNSSGEVASVTFSVYPCSDTSYLFNYACIDASYYKTKFKAEKNWNYIEAFGYKFGTMILADCNYVSSSYYCRGNQYIFISPTSDNPDSIIHIELTKASSTDLTAEKVSCIYSSEEVKPNTAAIQTDIPTNGYTVGGVRPTFPVRGDVWMPVSNNRISGVYIYNGSAWEETNARWYTGTRWIPIYAFDLTTLEDCWDIADIDTTIVMIGSESQFWSWLQGAWQKMLDKLDAIIIALGGDPNYSPDSSGGGGTGLWDRIKTAFSDALASIIESLMSFITDVLQLVLDLVYDLLSFFFDFLSTEVVTGIANLFSSFTDGSLLLFFQQEIIGTDENGNEVTTTVIGLPDGVATAFAFFAGVIMILPDELRNLLIFGVGALILIGILKLAKS